jgi:hypothetical protein
VANSTFSRLYSTDTIVDHAFARGDDTCLLGGCLAEFLDGLVRADHRWHATAGRMIRIVSSNRALVRLALTPSRSAPRKIVKLSRSEEILDEIFDSHGKVFVRFLPVFSTDPMSPFEVYRN